MTIGVLCLETAFEKIPGHIRNPATFDFPVDYEVAVGATPDRVVSRPDPALLRPFIDAARALEARGCSAITGACGFLVLFQRELADAVTVPLFASSLIQLPMVARMIGADRKVGLLVARKAALTPRHLAAIGAADVPVCVAGVDDSTEFREVMMEGRRLELDVPRLEREVMAEVDALARANPDLGAMVIECTDLVPFAHAIQARLGIPVFDIVTLTVMVEASLRRRPF
jgi:hypothetical protein